VRAYDEPENARIRSLDFLRGAAILGMLVANIPWHAGDSMSRVQDPDLPSVTAWLLQYLVFDQRFMPIFCMLFGASALLLVSRPSTPAPFASFFLTRMLVLFFLGVLHAYLLWPGDILITYAVCAPFLLLAINQSARRLLLLGLALKAVDVLFAEWPQLYEATLYRILFEGWVAYGDPPSSIGEAYAGSYSELLAFNAWRNQFLQWTALPEFRIWNALGFMYIGMAMYRLGVLQGAKSPGFYKKMLFLALVPGAPLVVYGVISRVGINPTVGVYLGFTQELPYRNLSFAIGCATTSFAMLAALQLVFQRWAGRVTEPIERVGRMALTNYLLHSLIFVGVFHVFGLLPFDALDHDVLLFLVLLTWVFQIGLSWCWLSAHDQGPIEWIWRRISLQLFAMKGH